MAGLTTRQQMAKGSKWKVKADFSAENKYASDYGWRPKPTAEYPNGRELVQTVKKMTDFKAGEIITIHDKATTYHPKNYDKGLFIPLTFDNRGDAYGQFEFKDISDKLELEQAVEQLIYAFWSPSMGYISSIPWQYDRYMDMASWQTNGAKYPEDIPTEYKLEHEQSKQSGGILFADKLTKALKKKRSQDTKMFLLSHSGYYDGIDTSDIYYVFEPGGKKVDFPDDLEIQTIDKATKAVKETFLAKDYLAEAFRLRPLTLKYGSAIRSVFKDMEAKGKDFTTLLMFQDPDINVNSDDKSKLIDDLKADFKSQKFDKSSYIMKSDYRTVAFAFKNRNDAVMFRLSAGGDLDVKLVDAETLDDVKLKEAA